MYTVPSKRTPGSTIGPQRCYLTLDRTLSVLLGPGQVDTSSIAVSFENVNNTCHPSNPITGRRIFERIQQYSVDFCQLKPKYQQQK